MEVWEKFLEEDIYVDLGSDQTSLHNPFAGGYYPVGLSFEESNQMMAEDPNKFKEVVYASLRRHAAAVDAHTSEGTYFFDYGNAFLLEASRASINQGESDVAIAPKRNCSINTNSWVFGS